jgi:hypothetical protein
MLLSKATWIEDSVIVPAVAEIAVATELTALEMLVARVSSTSTL